MDFGRIVEFAGNHMLLVAALAIMIFLVAFYETRRNRHGGHQLSPAQAVGFINGGAAVIDVRAADAFRGGHIVGARNIPLETANDSHAWLGKQRKKALLFTCDNGAASGRAVLDLRKKGFEQLFALRGGLNAWRQENFPLVKDDDKPAEKGGNAKKNRTRENTA